MSTPDDTTGFLAVHTSGGPKTINLPHASSRIGRVITIKDVDGDALTNTITIAAIGGDTIDGVTSYAAITRPYGFYSFTAQSATNWSITNKDIDADIVANTIAVNQALISTIIFPNQRGDAPPSLTENGFQIYVSNSVLYYQDVCQIPVQPLHAVMMDYNIASTVTGLGSAKYISSVTGGLQDIISTVAGLGTAGYISSTQLQSSILGAMSTTSTLLKNWANYNATSSITFENTQNLTYNSLVTRGTTLLGLQSETAVLAYNETRDTIGFAGQSFTLLPDVRNLGGGPLAYYYTLGAGQSYTGSVSAPTFLYTDPNTFANTIASFYTSTLYIGNTTGTTYGQLYSDTTNTDLYWNGTKLNNSDISPALRSTVQGLGTVNYISSAQLISTTAGLVEIPELTSTTLGLATLGYLSSASDLISSLELASTVTGLGSANYISSAQLISTTAGLVEIQELTSTTRGLGTLTYISSAQLISSITGLGSANYISSAQLISTTAGLVEIQELTSTTRGLGTLTYISSAQLISSITGLGSANYLSSGVIRSLSSVFLSSGNILTSSVTNRITFFNDYAVPTGIVTTLYSSTNYLMYNSSIIGGARVAEIQTIVF